MNLENEFKLREPWITKFMIGGVEYGGNFDAMRDARISQFFDCFPNVRTVLELGSLEGGHSLALAAHPKVERVVAIEARERNIDNARFVQRLLNDTKVEFILADLEKLELESLGTFDAVFCSGILYHLPEPWKLFENCGTVTSNLFIWTQYACENQAKKFSGGYRGKWYREGGWLDPLSGVSKYSFWLSMGSLLNVLTVNGFRHEVILENNLDHPNGCAVTLAARKLT
jgi:SAM-dependent methyltransferase